MAPKWSPKWSQNVSRIGPQNGPKLVSTWSPKWSRIGPKTVRNWSQNKNTQKQDALEALQACATPFLELEKFSEDFLFFRRNLKSTKLNYSKRVKGNRLANTQEIVNYIKQLNYKILAKDLTRLVLRSCSCCIASTRSRRCRKNRRPSRSLFTKPER